MAGYKDYTEPNVPAGVIAIWAGSLDAIPPGWLLCDGNNGTPDLRGRFLVGAGSSYAVDDTGGEDEHTLTSNELPSHNHGYELNVTLAGSSTGQPDAGWYQTASDNTTDTGGGQAHENRPPYLALAFIMKA